MKLRETLSRVTILQRIVIGNMGIIILGFVAAVLITRTLTIKSGGWGSLVIATLAVIMFVSGINLWIVNAALRPLRDLGRLAKRLQSESSRFQVSPQGELKHADPFTARMANTLSSLFLHLEERNQELRALSERAINAQEAERQAIAQSLHDDTGQALTMLAIQLDRILERIPDDEAALRKLVGDARAQTASALAELRRILVGLRPAILDDLGLVPAIRWYARTHLESAGIRVTLKAPVGSLNLPPPVSTTLFRISQEAMNNILRHAHASAAAIELEVNTTEVHLQIEDNGAGFDQERVSFEAVPFNHLGLVGMRERAQLLGGKVIIQSSPGKGSLVQAVLPLEQAGKGKHGAHTHLAGG